MMSDDSTPRSPVGSRLNDSPDYRAEAESAPPPKRPSRLPGVVAALVIVGVLAVMITMQLKTADPPPPTNVRPVAFEIRLAETSPGEMLARATVRSDPTQTIYLHPEPLISNVDLKSASAIEVDGRTGIEFKTHPSAAERLKQATKVHLGKPVAIMIDGEVRFAPLVRSQIGRKGIIEGFSPVEAERIAAGMMQQ